MERYAAICKDCGMYVINRQTNHKLYGECEREQAKAIQDFKIGMRVEVSHIGGTEIGYIDQSILNQGKLFFISLKV
jgi:hypothetical protein